MKTPLQAVLLVALVLSASSLAAPPKKSRLESSRKNLEAALASGNAVRSVAAARKVREAALVDHARDRVALADALIDLAQTLIAAPTAEATMWSESEALIKEGLQLRRQRFGNESLEAAEAESLLSNLYYYSGRWAEAESLARTSLSTRSKLLSPDDPRLITSHKDVGVILYQQGRLRDAEREISMAQTIASRITSLDRVERARLLNILAEVQRALGRYDEARDNFTKGLALVETESPESDASRRNILNNLAGLEKDQTRYAQAERYLHRAIEALMKRPADFSPFDLADAHLNRAELLRLQRRFAEAAPDYERALAAARLAMAADDPQLIWFVNQFAVLNAERGDFDQAEKLYLEASCLAEKGLPPDHPLAGQIALDLARTLTAANRQGEAAEYFAKAIAVRRSTYGPRHPETALVLFEMAKSSKSDEDALALTDQTIDILGQSVAYPDTRAGALALRSRLLHGHGQTLRAIVDLREAIDAVEAIHPNSGGGEVTRATLAAEHRDYYTQLVGWLLERNDLATAFEYAERGSARILIERLATRGVDLRAGIAPEKLTPLARAESELGAELAEIRVKLEYERSRSDVDATLLRQRVAALDLDAEKAGRRLQTLRDEIEELSPLWKSIGSSDSQLARLDDAVALARRDGVNVFRYVVGSDQSWLMTIDPKHGPRAVRLTITDSDAAVLGTKAGDLGRAALHRLINGDQSSGGFFEEVSSGRLTKRGVERSAALARTLLPSSTIELSKSGRPAVVVPDAALQRLPFDALVVKSDSVNPRKSVFWIDLAPTPRYAPSITAWTLLSNRRSADSNGEVLVVADPLFTSGTAAELGPLPGTADEARAIRSIAEREKRHSIVLTKHEASEGKVRLELAKRPAIIHFATHGLIEATAGGALTALALTSNESGSSSDDGLLQLYEIYGLDLRSDLTVLSACDTNSGTAIEGEGVFGLARAFLASGSQRVIATLWPVADESTTELMRTFYDELLGGRNHRAALTKAKRALRRSERWSAPYFWSGFVQIGAE